jgi:hypothetical protein
MPDLERLHADAEEAQVFSEVARSQLLTAKASARERKTFVEPRKRDPASNRPRHP